MSRPAQAGRIVGSNEPVRTEGRFAVDAASGCVLKSVLSVTGSTPDADNGSDK